MATGKKIVMSGMRPTGKLHLGHYLGVLKSWLAMQDDYECYFSIADWHALTTKYDDTASLRDDIYQIALDWLAVGIDPSKATMYVQSTIPEIAVMHLLFSMFTPKKWLETSPTLKDMVADEDDLNYGLLGYPVLQTIDILSVRAHLVPIGKDQEAHLEISRDLARRFNHLYGTEYFPEPRPLFTEVSRLVGMDGRKMSKSYNNAIYLSDTEDETLKKVKTGITDKNRIKKDDPGNPDLCEVIYPYYQAFAPTEATALANAECRAAARGCMDCKKILSEIINEGLRPIRERRAELAKDRAQVEAMIKTGCEKSRAVHQQTLSDVQALMKLYR